MSKKQTSSLDLESFFPYLLSVATNRISKRLAATYIERFDLTTPEWRVMAVLHRFEPLSASELIDKTKMDKVAISRAVSRLLNAKRIQRSIAAEDRRRSILTLSKRGKKIYQEIEPLALDFEKDLLSVLSRDEQSQLMIMINALLSQSDKGNE